MQRKVKKVIKHIDNKLLQRKLSFVYSKLLGTKEKTLMYSYDTTIYYDASIKEQMDATDIKKSFHFERLDLCVSYLLFKELIMQSEIDIHQKLFCTVFDHVRGQSQLWLQEAVQFYERIRQKGIQSERDFLYGKEFTWHDDMHQLACYMALNTNEQYEIENMDFKWFCDHGFSTENKIRILRAYADIHQSCGLFILFGTVQDQWTYLESIIQTKVQIVGSFDLDFINKDSVAYANLIYEIYYECNSDVEIDRMISVLCAHDLVMRIVLVSDELNEVMNLYENIHELEIALCEKIKSGSSHEHYIACYSTDTLKKFKDLREIVLSVNNLKNLSMRILYSKTRLEMAEMINAYKKYMDEHDIDINDSCIVGSTSLELVGIRNSEDIDIVIAPELREEYGNEVTHLTEKLDIAIRNYVRNSEKCLIRDEQLIYDDNCHFIFMGCKFVNIEYILYKKLSCNREKDIRDAKLIKRFLRHKESYKC